MALTKTGADKIAAKKIGISVEEYYTLQAAGMKWCTKGKHWQPIQQFCVDSSRKSGLASKCRECSRSGDISKPPRWERKAKHQLGLDWCSICCQWKPQIEIRGGYCRPCTNANERYRYIKDSSYRGRRRQHAHARKRNVEPISDEIQEAVIIKFGGMCVYCGKKATTWDHVIPVSKGGDNSYQNIVTACVSCNSSKKTQEVRKWILHKGIKPMAGFYEHTGMKP